MTTTLRGYAVLAATLAVSISVLLACAPQDQATPGSGQSASAMPSESASPSPESPSPTIEKRIVTKNKMVPYRTRKVYDASLAKGRTKVRTEGVPGVKSLTYEVTYVNGEETGRRLLRTEVTRKPVTKVLAIGTKVVRRCDPNYGGACVPVASDVDCAGGGGDGPAYVRGPVTVVGNDIYDLDRDGDGVACD